MQLERHQVSGRKRHRFRFVFISIFNIFHHCYVIIPRNVLLTSGQKCRCCHQCFCILSQCWFLARWFRCRCGHRRWSFCCGAFCLTSRGWLLCCRSLRSCCLRSCCWFCRRCLWDFRSTLLSIVKWCNDHNMGTDPS